MEAIHRSKGPKEHEGLFSLGGGGGLMLCEDEIKRTSFAFCHRKETSQLYVQTRSEDNSSCRKGG